MTTEDNTTTDVERIACTLLHRATVVHPILRAWRTAITTDPDFAEILSLWRPPAEAVRQAEEAGFKSSGDLWGAFLDEEAHPRDPQWQPFRSHDVIYAGVMDSAAARLGRAIVNYRQDARPDGEQVREITYGTEAIALVYTSIGAAILEYHEAVVGAWAAEMMRREEDADARGN